MMDYDLLHEISLIDREIIKIDRGNTKSERLEKINLLRDDYNMCKEDYEELKNTQKLAEDTLKDMEVRIQACNEELKDYESKLYSTSSMKVIDGFLKSIEKLKHDICEYEEKSYKAISDSESMGQRKSEIYKKAKAVKLEYDSLKDEYNLWQKDIQDRKRELNAKREEIVSQLGQGVIKEYECIRKDRGYGMSEVKGEICTGCGMSVPCIIISEVRTTKKLKQCPNCGRFIYIKD